MSDDASLRASAPGFDRNDVELLERTRPFKGRFQIDVYRLRHRRFAGGWTPPIEREVYERGSAVAILLYDPDRDVLVFVEQFRAGAYAAGRAPWMLEVVAGIVDPGESPDAVARREAEEEAGCRVLDMELAAEYLPSPGGCSEVITLFAGRVDARGVGGLHGLAHEHEDIRVQVLPAPDAIARLDRPDGYPNGVALVAMGWFARHHSRLRAQWVGPA